MTTAGRTVQESVGGSKVRIVTATMQLAVWPLPFVIVAVYFCSPGDILAVETDTDGAEPMTVPVLFLQR